MALYHTVLLSGSLAIEHIAWPVEPCDLELRTRKEKKPKMKINIREPYYRLNLQKM